jgi:beta-glucosidase
MTGFYLSGRRGVVMKHTALIKKMSLEEKASLMSGKDFFTTKAVEKHNIPSMLLSDGPHGIRKQAGEADNVGLNPSLPATCYPTSATIANSWNPEMGEEMAAFIGKEAVSLGVSVLLGPGTNIKRNPLCGRNFEYFSEDPFLAGKMAAAYTRGIQSQGISACLKHFACNNQEYRRMVIDSIVDERTLREIYLTPFRMGIEEGDLKTIMTSYNMLNGTHTNENQHLMKDILRDEWKFNGLVVTDWGGSNDRIKGLIAGNSLEMPGNKGETDEDIIQAIKNGELDEKVLDENVERYLELLFDTQKAFIKEPEKFDIEKHHAMAQKAAEESIVLLKNKDKVLPLNNKDKVAIIGDFAQTPRYQGAGSSIVNPTKIDDTISSVKEYDLNYVGFEPGYKRYGKSSRSLIKKAMKLAENADVLLLYLGLHEYSEVEGIDRTDMLLPKNQLELLDELVTLNKKIVVILACGSPVEIDFETKVDAIVHSYLSGQAGAKATLNVLTGKVNPSGKLAETLMNSYQDTPTYNYFPGKEMTVEYREGLFVGYRYFDTNKVAVKYPFGFGLSYTDFQYSDLVVTKDLVTFKMKNVGDVAGSEVAQLYIGAKNSQVTRPLKELKGFAKVSLNPGEIKEVAIKLDDKAFRFFNPETMKWEIEELDYEIFIGSSSQTLLLKETLHVEGVTLDPKLKATDLPHYFKGDIQNVSVEEFEKLLGRKVPKSTYDFYKKNRLVVGYNTTTEQLKYSKRWVGRLFYRAIRFANKFLHLIGNHTQANVLEMGVVQLPMRGLAHMSGGMITWRQLDGLIAMFNGHFFKGVKMFFSGGRKRSKQNKLTEKRDQEK